MSREIKEKATLAAGCFWCVEAVYQRIEGVLEVIPGYLGGQTEAPSYEEVCRGDTGHAEAVEIVYDPSSITYEKLLDLFWQIHDPTTLNQQGADIGTQYRSAIFYHNDAQRAIAERSKQTAQAMFDQPIVTEVTAATAFTPAERYHHNYYNDNRMAGYCRMVIAPKLQKLGFDG